MIYAGTGHRPDKLGGYSKKLRRSLFDFAVDVLEEAEPTTVISGMALGWDQALAAAAHALGIPFWAAVPWPEQHVFWPDEDQRRYEDLLKQAEQVFTVEAIFSYASYQKRNIWMVEHCDYLLALWNKKPGGGTHNCIRYANRVKRPVINLWDRWKELNG